MAFSLLLNDRQRDKARVIDPLSCLSKVRRLSKKDVLYKSLRVAVIQREPARLDLHHDLVSRQKHMISIRQSPLVEQRFGCLDWLCSLIALTIAAAEDIHRYSKLVSAELR